MPSCADGRGRSCCAPTRRSARPSRRSSSTSTASSPGSSPAAREAVDPEEFQRYFVAQGRFTAGVATRYAPSMITAEGTHQHLAEGFPVGMRFHSAPVLRLADAKPVELGHVARADGAWRVYVFADAEADPRPRAVRAPGAGRGPVHAGGRRPGRRHRPARRLPAGPSRAGRRRAAAGASAAEGRLRPHRLREGVLPRPAGGDIFDLRGVDRGGCAIVVRPDGYVADVLPLDAHEELAGFLGGVLLEAR